MNIDPSDNLTIQQLQLIYDVLQLQAYILSEYNRMLQIKERFLETGEQLDVVPFDKEGIEERMVDILERGEQLEIQNLNQIMDLPFDGKNLS